jgi:hypothetical protein
MYFSQRDIDEFRVALYLLGEGELVDRSVIERFVGLGWLRESAEVSGTYWITPEGQKWVC